MHRSPRPARSSAARAAAGVLALTLGLAAGCGKKADAPAAAKEDAGAPQVAPLTMPALGVDQIVRFNFVYDAGRAAFDKATAAARAKDWAAAREHAAAAVAKDARHLDAHWLLGQALAQLGEHAAAVEPLVTALAADYLSYSDGLTSSERLREFLTTPHGQAVQALAARIGAEYARMIPGAVWLVARRSTFKMPTSAAFATPRGELYAYDLASKRYLRLTHTNHAVAGFVRAPGGGEVVALAFETVDPGKSSGKLAKGAPAPADAAPPTFKKAWVWRHDTTTWQPVGRKVDLPAARELGVGYGPGDQLLVTTAPATGRWTLGALKVASVDTTTGKLTVVGSASPPAPRIALTLDEGRVVRAPDGVTATWEGEPATAPALTPAGGPAIAIPESGKAAQATVALAPGGAHVAFATAVDPCAPDAAPSLYVATTKTGALKHVLTARSRFATRWVSPTLLAYEDGEGGIRLWDVTTGREQVRLENKPGIALDVLSAAAAPVCSGAPAAPAEPPAEGEPAEGPAPDEAPLPPEEPAPADEGGGPVTRPQ